MFPTLYYHRIPAHPIAPTKRHMHIVFAHILLFGHGPEEKRVFQRRKA